MAPDLAVLKWIGLVLAVVSMLGRNRHRLFGVLQLAGQWGSCRLLRRCPRQLVFGSVGDDGFRGLWRCSVCGRLAEF